MIGIDGNMWYCSNDICLAEPQAKYTFERTLREAVEKYQDEFNINLIVPLNLVPYLDKTPEEYKEDKDYENG